MANSSGLFARNVYSVFNFVRSVTTARDVVTEVQCADEYNRLNAC